MSNFNFEQIKAYKKIKDYKRLLSKKQIDTLKGQIKAGDCNGALKGIQTIVERSRLARLSNEQS